MTEHVMDMIGHLRSLLYLGGGSNSNEVRKTIGGISIARTMGGCGSGLAGSSIRTTVDNEETPWGNWRVRPAGYSLHGFSAAVAPCSVQWIMTSSVITACIHLPSPQFLERDLS
ncbi:unnamed protein product [Ectocarpus sp. 12 AP-2014]